MKKLKHVLVSTMLLLGSAQAGARMKSTQAQCAQACTNNGWIQEQCGWITKRAKFDRCRTKVITGCRKRGASVWCPDLSLPTTTVPYVPPPTTTQPYIPPTTTVLYIPPTTTTLPPTISPTCDGQLLVVATDGTYLGCVTCSTYDPDSIFNQYGSYGSPYSSTSINNQFSAYGSPYSSTSACNQYTSTPPLIVDDQDCFYWSMSVNPYVSDSVCGITGDATLCSALEVLCAS
jgi:hypothetical protein